MKLRPIEPEDLDFAYLIENDMSMWHCSSATAPVSRYQLHQFIAESRHDLFADRQIRLVIDVDDTPVGFADIFNFDPQHHRAEIGLVIARQHSGNGYAHEALNMLADYARHAHIHQLYAVVEASNTHCIHVLETSGYKRTATYSDWIFDGRVYSDANLYQFFL